MSGPLMIDLEGARLSVPERERLAHEAVGGVILFARNYESPAQLRALVQSIRQIRPRILIGVDQEGGRVQRFQSGLTRIPPMRSFGHAWDHDPGNARAIAYAAGWLMASELRDMDVDFSFAPVLDVDHSVSSVIGDRSFHSDPKAVAELAGAWIDGMHEGGMASVGKHFPGHGAIAEDSHHELPSDGRTLERILEQDAMPFRELADKLDAVMPAHVVYPEVDELPAGFSPFWLKNVLSREVGFRGVVISDDLTMAGAALAGEPPARAQAALDAGCDLLLVCNDPDAADSVAANLSEAGARASAGLVSLRGKPLPGPRGAFRSTARYRDTRAALLRMLDEASA
ncbi:beta-N-acetylhexosaminidase [Salicola sp. Rm-C-2C1-2]|uniref:beta-N-acetylhexosaminidase n=1 Tax=Salicola sp. Rm-C-2C1-2 TaxID=3141321 RepID=UPI0032E52EEB